MTGGHARDTDVRPASTDVEGIANVPSTAMLRHIHADPLFRRNIADALRAFAAATPRGSRVLDAGAGNAPYRTLFAHCDYVTADWPNSPHADAANVDIVADLRDIPRPDAYFDAVVLTEVLEHVAEPTDVLAELSRILRPGGRIFVTVPFVIYLHESPYDYARYTCFALERLLGQASFTEARTTPLGGAFSVLAMCLHHIGRIAPHGNLASRVRGEIVSRLAHRLAVVVSRAAPRLDRLDGSSGLPLGWLIVGTKAP
jgi:SAM-dependent methyltransferase